MNTDQPISPRSTPDWTLHLRVLAFFQATVAFLGSMSFSEIMLYPPCVLCWYQRITMFPLVILLGVSLWKKDTRVYQYVLPLSLIGLSIAGYHNLLYWEILPQSLASCRSGVSCTSTYVEYLGFITIPLLSFTAHAVVSALMIALWRRQRRV